MAKLTKDQIDFLKSIGVSENETLDATGLKKEEYKKVMEENNLAIAFGLKPCTNGGHTLKTRSGHCIQCRPLDLTFQKRHTGDGFIYIAHSNTRGYIKIGVTSNVSKRQSTLRNSKYGGYIDWVISGDIYVEKNAGLIETKLQISLKEFKVSGTYFRDGEFQNAKEMFEYPVEKAIKELRKIAEQYKA